MHWSLDLQTGGGLYCTSWAVFKSSVIEKELQLQWMRAMAQN